MIFNSFDFLVFFIAICILFFALKPKYRWILLLAGSYFFYMYWRWELIFLIIASTFIDYYCGLKMSQKTDKRDKRPYLWISIFSNLSILLFFKYFDFFLDSINIVSGSDFNMLNLILPMGISFYTFQTLSYSIDVYRGKISGERHLGKFAVYVTFFPQLVAGPIERAEHLLPQFKENNTRFTYENFVLGGTQIVIGLFKKVAVADLLSIYVDTIYSNYEVHTGLTLAFATYVFAIQVYCDFSGYSDIAIGTAKILGYDLMDNFKAPFFSISITEFWRKWHISLSTWLRDYLYISLGGNRRGVVMTHFNIIFTMFICGLWHGAAWTYVVWGTLQGLILSIEKVLNYPQWISARSNVVKFISGILTFNLFCLGLVFFRSASVSNALSYISKIFSKEYFWNLKLLDTNVFGSMAIVLVVFFILEILLVRVIKFRSTLASNNYWLLVCLNAVLIYLIILFGINEGSQFIYFQF